MIPPFYLGLMAGLFIGAFLGVVLMGLLVMAKRSDMDRYIFPVYCECGWFGMSDDCRQYLCPFCGARVKREKE